ncbi:MAG TPA: GtrA family protein, partial [Alphaproteobacteria bacterium]|nr:GtrA family protein [Alphaproteobacteria bacterium]
MLLTKKIHIGNIREFLFFALVGGFGTLVNTAILYLLIRFTGINYLLASAIATEIAIISNFFGNNYFTFKDHNTEDSLWKKFLSFQLISLISLVGTVFFLWVFVNLFGRDLILVWNILAIILMFVANFILNSIFTWNKKRGNKYYEYKNFALLFAGLSLLMIFASGVQALSDKDASYSSNNNLTNVTEMIIQENFDGLFDEDDRRRDNNRDRDRDDERKDDDKDTHKESDREDDDDEDKDDNDRNNKNRNDDEDDEDTDTRKKPVEEKPADISEKDEEDNTNEDNEGRLPDLLNNNDSKNKDNYNNDDTSDEDEEENDSDSNDNSNTKNTSTNTPTKPASNTSQNKTQNKPVVLDVPVVEPIINPIISPPNNVEEPVADNETENQTQYNETNQAIDEEIEQEQANETENETEEEILIEPLVEEPILPFVMAQIPDSVVAVSQLGYHPSSVKQVVVYTDAVEGSFKIRSSNNGVVATLPLEKPKNYNGDIVNCQGNMSCLVGDFTSFTTQGSYYIDVD